MPATIIQQPIPVPTADNLLQVVAAIRQALITSTGSAARSAQSQFLVTDQIIVPVTYTLTLSGGITGTVVVPQLTKLVLFNPTNGERWSWTAPTSLTRGGTIGQPYTA